MKRKIFHIMQWWRNRHDAPEIRALREQLARQRAAHKPSAATLRAIKNARTERLRAAVAGMAKATAAFVYLAGGIALVGVASLFPGEAEAATDAPVESAALDYAGIAFCVAMIAYLAQRAVRLFLYGPVDQTPAATCDDPINYRRFRQ